MTMVIARKWLFRARAIMAYGFSMMVVGIWLPDNPFAGRFIGTGAIVLILGVVLLVFESREKLIMPIEEDKD